MYIYIYKRKRHRLLNRGDVVKKKNWVSEEDFSQLLLDRGEVVKKKKTWVSEEEFRDLLLDRGDVEVVVFVELQDVEEVLVDACKASKLSKLSGKVSSRLSL